MVNDDEPMFDFMYEKPKPSKYNPPAGFDFFKLIKGPKNAEPCIMKHCKSFSQHSSGKCERHRTLTCAECKKSFIWNDPPNEYKPRCARCRKKVVREDE